MQSNASFEAVEDLIIESTINGTFFTNRFGEADPSLPDHPGDVTDGYHLKGARRTAMGAVVSKEGVNQAYLNQYGNIIHTEHQFEYYIQLLQVQQI